MKKYRIIKTSVDILLMVFIVLYILTGFGVTEYRIVESVTFSVLSKSVSHIIHSNLIIPFIAILITHILLSTKKKYFIKLFGRFDINEGKN